MSDQALKAAWQYFRMGVGTVLVISFVYMMLTGNGEGDITSRLLMLLMGLLQIGSGFVNARNGGSSGSS